LSSRVAPADWPRTHASSRPRSMKCWTPTPRCPPQERQRAAE
jgi:hypothetical protein